MITDPDRFSQDKSPYERPDFRYLCGRIGLWGKPCDRGPNSDGGCGGVRECTPFFDADRWKCRRSKRSGGPCEDGPLPDGQCCNQHPPCKPVLTLRGARARLTMLAAALIVALIGAFAFNGARAIGSLSPGAISSGHAQFTGEKGCAACHAPHNGDATAWIRAAWSPNGLTKACESCHEFDGPATLAHNEIFDKSDDRRRTQCIMCHTEHKGAEAKITKMADQQCNACHKVKFASFSTGHPPFSKTYPSRRRTAIAFNHVTHFNKYFQYKRFSARKPKERCITCHDTGKASRNLPVRPFEESCAACHEQQIPKRDLVVFTLPEFAKDPFDARAVGEACGPSAQMLEAAGEDADKLYAMVKSWRAWTDTRRTDVARRVAALRANLGRIETESATAGEAYLSVSEETLPPAAVLLLGLDDGENADRYGAPVRDLVMAMIGNGVEALAAGVEGRPDAGMLFAGLSPDLLRRAGCAWAANWEYEAPDSTAGGWFADALSLRYSPPRHGDPVVKAWVELAATGGGNVGNELRGEIFSPAKGPGACAKCHSVNADAGARLRIAWNYGTKSDQRHLRYSHAPHLDLLGPGKSCETCHKIDETAAYDAAFSHVNALDFASNFKPIERKYCTACHAEGKVRQDCALCHEYHNGHGFKRRMTTAAKE